MLLYETCVSNSCYSGSGLLYELAATVTDQGSDRQQVHPDLPFKQPAPLYVVFVALQDVSLAMGPTTFLPGTHTAATMQVWSQISQRDAFLGKSKSVVATLMAGDAVVFDARILHCGNANEGATRALFNFSFRNGAVTGDLGYKGSIRPGYENLLTLDSIGALLAEFSAGRNKDPFLALGDGLNYAPRV